ncbi:MAG TPA: hypothetical protein VKU41_00345, partial [Polyangiaceae bacterium]|nr:hypothetical protein [Polyangiaceae bacterium]
MGRARVSIALAFALAHCGRGTPAKVSAVSSSAGSDAAPPVTAPDSGAPMDLAEANAWTLAKDGEEEDRMHLAGRVGCTGLRERADEPALRLTAIRAMAYC